jgi:hypothetical protein
MTKSAHSLNVAESAHSATRPTQDYLGHGHQDGEVREAVARTEGEGLDPEILNAVNNLLPEEEYVTKIRVGIVTLVGAKHRFDPPAHIRQVGKAFHAALNVPLTRLVDDRTRIKGFVKTDGVFILPTSSREMYGLAAIFPLRRLGLQLSEAREQHSLIGRSCQTSFLVPG